jgi:hypothetical protein
VGRVRYNQLSWGHLMKSRVGDVYYQVKFSANRCYNFVVSITIRTSGKEILLLKEKRKLIMTSHMRGMNHYLVAIELESHLFQVIA